MYKDTENGFKLMNEALKKRVEVILATDQVPEEKVETLAIGE